MGDLAEPRLAWARLLARGHGTFYVLSGAWPLVHLQSFLAVTGPKTDLWLVQTFGLLVAGVGTSLLLNSRDPRLLPLRTLGLACALPLALADVTFCVRGAIGPVYLLDAAVELALAALWLVTLRRSGTPPSQPPRRA